MLGPVVSVEPSRRGPRRCSAGLSAHAGGDERPRTLALDLERQVEQEGIRVMAAHDLHPHREVGAGRLAGLGPVGDGADRDGARRVADDVERTGEGEVVLDADLLPADTRVATDVGGERNVGVCLLYTSDAADE